MKTKELQELGQWKVGETVTTFQRGTITGFRKISRITDGRGGTIYVYNKNISLEVYETAYDIYGNQRGADIWNTCSIEPTTDAHRQIAKEAKAYNFLQDFNWKTLTPAQAIQIADTIKGFSEKPLDKPA